MQVSLAEPKYYSSKWYCEESNTIKDDAPEELKREYEYYQEEFKWQNRMNMLWPIGHYWRKKYKTFGPKMDSETWKILHSV